jgi:small subunit ribosomal protein S18
MVSQEEIKFLSNSPGSAKEKYCRFCKFGIKHIDYKDPDFLIQFVNEQGKLAMRTGNSLKYQRRVSSAVKLGHLAMLPFSTDLLK